MRVKYFVVGFTEFISYRELITVVSKKSCKLESVPSKTIESPIDPRDFHEHFRTKYERFGSHVGRTDDMTIVRQHNDIIPHKTISLKAKCCYHNDGTFSGSLNMSQPFNFCPYSELFSSVLPQHPSQVTRQLFKTFFQARSRVCVRWKVAAVLSVPS